MVGVVAQPVAVQEVVRLAQLRARQHLRAADALMGKVVDRVADPLVGQHLAVLLIQQHRHQPGLPVMAVDDIRPLVGLEHELKGRLGKEAEPLGVVRVPIQQIPVEEVVRRVRLDEKALAAMHMAKPHRAADRPAMPGHPQIRIADLQIPDIAIAHAGILRQHDLHRVAPDLQLPAQPGHHITQPARLRRGSTLGRHHHDVHGCPQYASIFPQTLVTIWPHQSPPARGTGHITDHKHVRPFRDRRRR